MREWEKQLVLQGLLVAPTIYQNTRDKVEALESIARRLEGAHGLPSELVDVVDALYKEACRQHDLLFADIEDPTKRLVKMTLANLYVTEYAAYLLNILNNLIRLGKFSQADKELLIQLQGILSKSYSHELISDIYQLSNEKLVASEIAVRQGLRILHVITEWNNSPFKGSLRESGIPDLIIRSVKEGEKTVIKDSNQLTDISFFMPISTGSKVDALDEIADKKQLTSTMKIAKHRS
jgi:hypothetical protein